MKQHTKILLFLTSVVAILCPSILSATPTVRSLSFGKLNGSSTIAQVVSEYPAAKTKRLFGCKPNQPGLTFADGFSSCTYASIVRYDLKGYPFTANFYFNASGTIKGISLNWPWPGTRETPPSSQELENAFGVINEMLASKYGSSVADPPCGYGRNKCREWQLDGSSKWHLGGERVRLRIDDDPKFGSVQISFEFVDRSEFNRF